MGSRDGTNIEFSDSRNGRQVDWLRYGLGNTEHSRNEQPQNRSNDEFRSEMYQTGVNELFSQEYVSNLFLIIIRFFMSIHNYWSKSSLATGF